MSLGLTEILKEMQHCKLGLNPKNVKLNRRKLNVIYKLVGIRRKFVVFVDFCWILIQETLRMVAFIFWNIYDDISVKYCEIYFISHRV